MKTKKAPQNGAQPIAPFDAPFESMSKKREFAAVHALDTATITQRYLDSLLPLHLLACSMRECVHPVVATIDHVSGRVERLCGRHFALIGAAIDSYKVPDQPKPFACDVYVGFVLDDGIGSDSGVCSNCNERRADHSLKAIEFGALSPIEQFQREGR